MLLESAKTSELINIKTPPKVSYVEKRNLLSLFFYHKTSTSHIEFIKKQKRGKEGRSLKSLKEGIEGHSLGKE